MLYFKFSQSTRLLRFFGQNPSSNSNKVDGRGVEVLRK